MVSLDLLPPSCTLFMHIRLIHDAVYQEGIMCLINSLVPRPHPTFHRLQYGKPGRAWYLFSCEDDVIGKWLTFSKQTGCISCIVQPTTRSMLGVYDNRPPLARYM